MASGSQNNQPETEKSSWGCSNRNSKTTTELGNWHEKTNNAKVTHTVGKRGVKIHNFFVENCTIDLVAAEELLVRTATMYVRMHAWNNYVICIIVHNYRLLTTLSKHFPPLHPETLQEKLCRFPLCLVSTTHFTDLCGINIQDRDKKETKRVTIKKSCWKEETEIKTQINNKEKRWRKRRRKKEVESIHKKIIWLATRKSPFTNTFQTSMTSQRVNHIWP